MTVLFLASSGGMCCWDGVWWIFAKLILGLLLWNKQWDFFFCSVEAAHPLKIHIHVINEIRFLVRQVFISCLPSKPQRDVFFSEVCRSEAGLHGSPVGWRLTWVCTAWLVQFCTVTVRVVIQSLLEQQKQRQVSEVKLN